MNVIMKITNKMDQNMNKDWAETNIVTRLRQVIIEPTESGFWQTIADAADEIERLRDELDSYSETRSALRNKIKLRAQERDEARAKVAKLESENKILFDKLATCRASLLDWR